MRVSITKITPVFPQRIFVQWDVIPDAGVSGSYTFYLERSGSPAGPWTACGPGLIDTVAAYDPLSGVGHTESVNSASLVRSMYYRVRALAPGGTIAVTDPMNIDGEYANDVFQQERGLAAVVHRKRLLRRKILRDEQLAFRVFNGIVVAVLKRRHFGVRCTVCYDPITKLNTKSRCTTCYGTGWTGGYYPPIATLARFAASSTDTSLTSEGKMDINNNPITLLNYPHVEEGDIIVEVGGNHRWLVKSVSPTELRRVTVHQRVLATELPRTSPEYGIILGGANDPL